MRSIRNLLFVGTLLGIFSLGVSRVYAVQPVETLSLQECIDQALQKNPSLLKIKEGLVRNKGVIVEARSGALPQVTAGGKLQTEDKGRFGEPFGPPQNEDSWGVSLRVTQVIFTGGKQNAAIEGARFLEQSILQDIQTNVDEIILGVRRNYYQAMLQRDLIQVSEKSIQLLQEEVEQQRKKLNAGSATKFNVLRAEVELANAKPPLIRAKNGYRNAIAELAKLMGYTMPKNLQSLPFQLGGEFIQDSPKIEVESLLERSVQYRPELKSLQHQIQSKEKRIKIDRASMLPSFSLFGGYDWLSDTRQKEMDNINEGYVAGIQGDWKIFDGLESKAKMDQTRSEIRQLQFQWEDQKAAIDVQVRRGYSNFLEAQELLLSQQKNVESAEESVRLARVREQAGAGLQIDILSSQVALTQSRTNELQAKHDLSIALSELERFTGIPMVVIDAASAVSATPSGTPIHVSESNEVSSGVTASSSIRRAEAMESFPRKRVELERNVDPLPQEEQEIRRAEGMVRIPEKKPEIPETALSEPR